MLSTICVECAGDHFGFGLTKIDPFMTKICAKNDFCNFRSKWPWPLVDLWPQICFLLTLVQRYVLTKIEVPMAYSCFEKNGVTRWTDDRRTDGQTECITLRVNSWHVLALKQVKLKPYAILQRNGSVLFYMYRFGVCIGDKNNRCESVNGRGRPLATSCKIGQKTVAARCVSRYTEKPNRYRGICKHRQRIQNRPEKYRQKHRIPTSIDFANHDNIVGGRPMRVTLPSGAKTLYQLSNDQAGNIAPSVPDKQHSQMRMFLLVAEKCGPATSDCGALRKSSHGP